MSKCENSIKEAAYYLWQNSGCPSGQDDYFWALATKELSSKCTKSCSSGAKKVSSCSAKKAATSKTTTAKKAPVKKASTAKK